MEKKKLLLIAPNLKQGGFQRVCARTASLLKDYYDIVVIAFDGTEIAYAFGEIPVLDIGVKAQAGIIRKILNVFRRIKRVKQIKRDYNISVSYSFGMSANLINVLSRVKDIVWCSIRSYIDLDTRTIGIVCRKSDYLICCSKVLEGYINKKYPKTPTVTIYNPFDVRELMQEAQEEIEARDKEFFEDSKRIIAAMGREDVLKGYWHLIKGFSKLDSTNVKLCIIGNGNFESEKKLVNDLGLEDRVYFTGGKKNPFAYLKYADIYVMSSVHEGFPNALVEAMALGIPVISTDCETGPAEILRENFTVTETEGEVEYATYGILIPSMTEEPDYTSDSEEEALLTEAVEALLQNRELYMQYKEKAKLRAETFNTKNYVDNFIKLARNI